MTLSTRVRNRDIPTYAWAVLFALLAVGLESVFHQSVRLPGHRALPGALAMILVARATTPRAVVVFTLTVCGVLALLPASRVVAILPWLALLPLLLLSQRTRFANAAWMLVGLGATFGLLRVGMLWGAVHKTPGLIRVVGHLSFGALGGGLAWAFAKALPRAESGA